MNIQSFILKLEKKLQLTKDIIELCFTKPDGFTFQAGQFVQFEIPDQDKMVLRSYSLSSTPDEKHLEFCVKILEGGKASALFQKMQAGENIVARGPRGMFINKETRPLTFIATGAGLAPIMGIIADELNNKKTNEEIRLLFGVRNEQDVFWADRLQQLANQHKNFQFAVTLSQPTDTWPGLRGRVTAHVNPIPINHHFFLCGSADMVKEVREILVKNGVNSQVIHFEIF